MMKKFVTGMAFAALLSMPAFASTTVSSTTDSSATTEEKAVDAAVVNAVNANPNDAAAVAFKALSTEQQKQFKAEMKAATESIGGAGVGAGANVGGFGGGMSNRMVAVRADMADQPMGAAGPTEAKAAWDVWANQFFNWSDQDDMKNHGSTKRGYESDTYGVIFGADRMMGNWIFGGSLGYSWTDVDANKVSYDTEVDSWLLGLYASYSTDKWYVDGGVSWAKSDIETERDLALISRKATGDTDSSSWSYFMNAGYNFYFGKKCVVTPFAGMTYIYTDTDGYTESGAGVLSMQIKDYDTDAFLGTVGVKASYAFTSRISGEVRASYTHDFVDEDPKVQYRTTGDTTGNYSEAIGLRADEDTWSLGAGLSGQINDATSVFVNYDWATKDEFDSHTVTSGVRFEF